MESIPDSGECGRNWLELPADIVSMILLKLGHVEILLNAQNVCSLWRKICKDPLMWRVIDMRNLGDLHDMDYDLVVMCMHAVDRSCGELVDINIEYFGTDELLLHIARSTNKLKRLRLVSCYDVSDEGMIEAGSKFPLLEHLELTFCNNVYSMDAVGRCFPLLKSLKLNNVGTRGANFECDKEALGIAKTMPNLRHLQIFGNQLTNKGLQAILDGCPDLESLDLRQCFYLNLTGELKQKCVERIKHLRWPDDPTDDYEFTADVANLEYADSQDEDYPSGFSDIDLLTDDDDHYEFSGGSYFSDMSDFDFY